MVPPPPPSQKGKFRPKKIKKVIRPGAAVHAPGAQADGESSASRSTGPTVAFDTSATATRSSDVGSSMSQRRRSSGRGSARGARGGGRGRGRAAIPQGRAFFTGGATSTEMRNAASKSGSGKTTQFSSGSRGGTAPTSSNGAGNRSSTGADTSTEEVVGELDTAIGGNALLNSDKKKDESKTSLASRGFNDDMDDYQVDSDRKPSAVSFFDPYTYDSDTSEENGEFTQEKRIVNGETSLLPPLQLPFEDKILTSSDVVRSSSDALGLGPSHENDEVKAKSPFALKDITDVDNSWFLIQLPTSLPPFEKQEVPERDNSNSVEVPDDMPSGQSQPSSSNNPLRIVSDVVTPPVLADKFDNILATAAPGRIGKLLVYKSGRTVLVMTSQDGEEVKLIANKRLVYTHFARIKLTGCLFMSTSASHKRFDWKSTKV